MYCNIKGLTYVKGTCPYSKGGKLYGYKEALDNLEKSDPTIKLRFFKTYNKIRKLLEPGKPPKLKTCKICGYASTKDICLFCRTIEKVRSK